MGSLQQQGLPLWCFIFFLKTKKVFKIFTRTGGFGILVAYNKYVHQIPSAGISTCKKKNNFLPH